MQDKITLEELALYLPYGLKYSFDGEDLHHTVIGMDITDMGIHLISPYNDYGTCNINRGKPILRPLSQLTQEIEHNGKNFIPIVELYKIACGNYSDAVVKYVDILSTTEMRHAMKGFSDFYFGIYQSENDVRLGTQYHFKLWSTDLEGRHTIVQTVFCQSLLFQKLHEWHFDLHNWIERGLALPIE